jgi:hypothetical protein
MEVLTITESKEHAGTDTPSVNSGLSVEGSIRNIVGL